MTPYNIACAVGAIIVALLFTAGTMSSQFWEVRTLQDITLPQFTVFLVLICTLASGHQVIPQWKQRHRWRSAALVLVFCWGSYQCITSNAARTVEASVPKLLERMNLNEQRAKLEADILDAKGDLRRATEAMEKACNNGVGPRCQGATKTRDQADSHYWMMVGRLANMKPAQPLDPGLEHAAKVFAMLPLTGTAESIQAKLDLLTPFATGLFFEIGTIVSWSIAFSKLKTLFAGNGHQLPTIAGKRWKTRRRKASKRVRTNVAGLPASDEIVVREALERKGRPVSNEELADLLQCSQGEASKRVAALNGLLSKERAGKYVAIGLKSWKTSASERAN